MNKYYAERTRRRRIGKDLADQLPVLRLATEVAAMLKMSNDMVQIIEREALYKIRQRLRGLE